MTTSPTPATCNHTYLSQSIHGKLPPLYFSNTSSTARSLVLLEGAYNYLKAHCRTRFPFEAREIRILRQELEAGMSRDRREQTQYYVLQIQDLKKRKAMEVYLARYPGFVMDGGGRLDYGLVDVDADKEDGEGDVIMKRLKEKLVGCVVM